MQCPNCSGQLEMHLNQESGKIEDPLPGDLSVCWFCGSKNIFDKNCQLVTLTSEMEKNLTELERNMVQVAWEVWNAKYSIRGS
jgi:hypothetical protein